MSFTDRGSVAGRDLVLHRVSPPEVFIVCCEHFPPLLQRSLETLPVRRRQVGPVHECLHLLGLGLHGSLVFYTD